MVKRRRKLSPEYEKLITRSLKEVELITAKINDIYDDDIREEYTIAFRAVKLQLVSLSQTYKEIGFNDDSIPLIQKYQESLNSFINEYEI